VVESVDAQIVRAPSASFVRRVEVAEGSAVKAGDRLLTLDLAAEQAELARARADLARADDALRAAEPGGPSGDAVQLDVDRRAADADIAHLARERDATERLVAKNAATSEELAQADLALDRMRGTREVLVGRRAERARRRGVDARLAAL